MQCQCACRTCVQLRDRQTEKACNLILFGGCNGNNKRFVANWRRCGRSLVFKKDRDSSEFNSHKCKDAMLSLLKDTKAAQEAEPKRKNGERVIDESELPEAVRKNMNKNKKD